MSPNAPQVPDEANVLRRALDAPTPVDLLSFASNVATVLEPPKSKLAPAFPEDDPLGGLNLQGFAETLIATPSEETDTLLVAWSVMLDDPVLRSKVQQQVRPRLKVVPPWFAELPRFHVERALVISNPLGGEETFALQVKGLRGGFILIVEVETLGNPFVEDVFKTMGDIEGLVTYLTEQIGPDRVQAKPMPLDQVRAKIEDALKITDMMLPPVETETWPGIRPLLEWQLRTMPEGGEGYILPEWTEKDRESLLDRFMASPHASGFGKSERLLAEVLVDLATNYGTGNPLQWSPRFVERLLLDLIPRKVMFQRKDMLAIPAVLQALIQFGNEALDVPESLARISPELVEELTPRYLDVVDVGSGQASRDLYPDFAKTMDPSFFMADPYAQLATAVGGEDSLSELSTEPLPGGEDFNAEGVPGDILESVLRVSDLVETHARDHFGDSEMVTAAQRTLRLIATENPQVFRRRAKDLNTAATILLITGENNRWFDRLDPDRTVKTLAKALGLTQVSKERARNMTDGIDVGEASFFRSAPITLGHPELLTSDRRQSILEEKRKLDALQD